MNISHHWLTSLAPGLSGTPREIADRLAMLGAPVDEIVDLGAELGDVVIARVEDVRPHPNADRLRICTVNAGGDPLQVVCGAPNVQAGAFYPFASIGAVLPGGFGIKKAKLRGEVSEGMLCSPRELRLGRDHDGLMTLHGEWEPGAPFRETLALDDARLVVDVTANRGELLSHLGVARELAPDGEDGIRLPPFEGGFRSSLDALPGRDEAEAGDLSVAIEDEDGCPRYMGAVVRGVRVGPSPEWLAGRLRAIGLRPINNVVDATNYVLHEMGQPLHAFDLHRLRGSRVAVRRARDGERLRTLDGEDRPLDADDLVIADGQGPIALAGVMGGEESEVGPQTTDLFLECALFDRRVVRRTARRLGLSTDASYRFERGVDPEGQPHALSRLVELITSVAGGAPAGAVDLGRRMHERLAVGLRPERVDALLGVTIPADEMRALLEPIGFEVDTSPSPPRVLVPGFRPDVTSEIDLIEEIARRRGYGSFPEVMRPYRPTAVPEDPSVAVARRLRALFVRHGFLEAASAAFGPETPGAVPLLNPLSAEEAFLRTALVPGLLRRVEHNFSHGVRDVRLFEIGAVFSGGAGPKPDEEQRLAAVLTGSRAPRHWTGQAPDFDVWDLKGLMEALGDEIPGAAVEARDGRLVLLAGNVETGGAEMVSAAAIDAPAWAAPVFALEVRLPAHLADRREAHYRPLPVHPGSERDLALLVPASVTGSEVADTIRAHAGELLEAVEPFDVYEGQGVPEGMRSIAFRLRFRARERTLTDAEVDPALRAVLAALEERHGVRRR
jgi:phenylalanyl-tRNA synthetase beta chain